ncbi:hypothetical protein VTL71DRAFT_15439 [Oculimacula yallundae]|uniref:F-box domain-containing protein n=1 Tax=Oculimacula yallundae TaxID=86028 RepID=A0ABR4CGK8_9HELO
MPTFTLFTLLAKELQLRIWELSIQTSPALIPRRPIACLAACRDWRSVYLKFYTRFFKSTAHMVFDYPISLYANLNLDDTLYLDSTPILVEDYKQYQERLELRYKIFRTGSQLRGVRTVNLVLTSSDYPVSVQESTRENEEQKFDLNFRKLVVCGATYLEDKSFLDDVREALREVGCAAAGRALSMLG